jgi:hypothetical protein
MPPEKPAFRESHLDPVQLKELAQTIAGTPLEPVVNGFEGELEAAGIQRVRPRFFLASEWGVPFPSTLIGIPFYLARPELTELHAKRTGFVEGTSPADILRYLRHEMGHVINYAYRLYDEEEWTRQFGAFTQPYLEDYRPVPFSRRYVRHLPGWYAQKHPDEDWAETFAVWLTPGLDWRREYVDRSVALGKLEYCQRTLQRLADQDPLLPPVAHLDDEGELAATVAQFYAAGPEPDMPPGLDGALRAVFEDLASERNKEPVQRKPAAELIRNLERDLMVNAYRWTGHFPERTRALLRYLARRAGELELTYPANQETAAVLGLTTLVTALAMNPVFFTLIRRRPRIGFSGRARRSRAQVAIRLMRVS